jgi:hypothetical protein
MWALIEDNNITKLLNRPKALTIGDVQYPANIFTLWSVEEKEALGIYEVVVDNTNLKDSQYYDNGAESFTFSDGVVTKSFGTATAKDLDSLKETHKGNINGQASGYLSGSDWYIVRNTEAGDAIPENISTFRTAVRTKANEMCDAIDAVADVDALAALYEYTNTGTEESPEFTRPLGEWPTLGE